MKLYGYTEKSLETQESPEALAEVTFVVNPEELRKIANFFNKKAKEIEELGTDFGHEHLADKEDGFDNCPQLIIYNDADL